MSVAIRAPRSNTKRCLRCRGILVWSDGGRLFHSEANAKLDPFREAPHDIATALDRRICDNKRICEKLKNSS